jgi:MGT family glycosyltransferase
MANSVVLAYPTYGHLAPILPVVAELAQRGEEIVCYGTGRSRARIESAGARFRPYSYRHDDFNPTPPTDGLFSDMARLAALTERLLPGLLDEVRAESPRYLLFDTKSLWGRLASAVLGIPAVTMSVVFAIQPSSIAVPELVARLCQGSPARSMLNGLMGLGDYVETARRIGGAYGVSLPGIIEYLGNPQGLNLIFTSREFQLDGPSFGDRYQFVGPSIPAGRDDAVAFPWEQLTGAPLIYVSLGTTFNQAPEFYRSCYEAFAGAPWQVALSTGGAPAASLPSPPPNFIVREFMPQLRIMEKASVFVTHGGMNSANEGLWHGVPLIVAPQRGDQYLVAARVAQLGAGLQLLPPALQPETFRQSVETVLGDCRYRTRARELGSTLRAAGGAVRAANLIQEFEESRSEVV